MIGNNMKWTKIFLALYLILKPYYLFHSGGLQVADIFLILAFLSFIVVAKLNKDIRKNLFETVASNKLLIIFTISTLTINAAYFLFTPDVKFLMSVLYYIFSLLAVTLFSFFAQSKNFLESISRVFKINLLIQLGIFLLGIGKDYGERYMGTFNDPNQFGYYILLSFFFIYIIKILLARKERVFPYLFIASFLVFQSASTGVFLGMAFFLIAIAIYNVKDRLRITYTKVRKFMYALVILIVITPLALLVASQRTTNQPIYSDLDSSYEDQVIVKRVSEKFSKAEGEADVSLWEERGYDKIFYYPEKMLYGAGEGALNRFTKASHEAEIHATFPSILFYYGIIPLLILLRWIYVKVKDSDPRIKIVYIALAVESFTLLNQRQALFWVILVIVSAYSSGNVIKQVNAKRARSLHQVTTGEKI